MPTHQLPQPLLLAVHDVCAGYEGKTVLENVSLNVFQGDFIGVIGPNGGGKTTLMRVMLGLHKPTAGRVTYYQNGRETSEITMGYLPQYTQIDRKFPISVYDVVLTGLGKQKPRFRPFTNAQHQQVKDTLEQMGLDSLSREPIEALSGGQLQRVLLARALVSNPDILILDEPNTYIDRRFQEQMYTMLDNINRHCAIVMVSHDVGSVLQNVKSVACVNRTLHYHPDTEISDTELREHLGCPIELVAHGDLPHRVLRKHS